MTVKELVIKEVPELEWCCGNLCDKEALIKQIQKHLEEKRQLKAILKELEPTHPLLEGFDDD